ncbi:polycystin-1 [Esox lucius]|uniref:Polycystic kidney disease 1b n=1 Tax=Esox lucius TaxID=8010 RepID=A0A3P9APB2_ESOLU|nr:polycystin-1 [Esox lucius]
MTEITDTERLALAWYLWLAVSFAAGVDEHLCPRGAQVHLASLKCYWLSTSAMSLLKAKAICRQVNGGELATVRNTETEMFIHNSFPLTFPEWVWVRNGRGQWPEGGEDIGTESPPGWDRESVGGCILMAQGSPGKRRNTTCDGQYLFFCEKALTVSLPSLDSYLTGVPLMSGVYARSELQILPTVPETDHQRVEMLLFPGLWFSNAGHVVSVELVSQPREVFTQVRVQILRPYCSPHHHLVPPGCSALLNPFSCCSTAPLCNTTGGCSLGQYWCHLLEACVPVTSPCSPYNLSPSTDGHSYLLPPRYSDIPPFYHLVADMPMRVGPSSEPAHVSVTLTERDIGVYPDDILAVQHTGFPGTFLRCRGNVSSSSSPWRQSYISLRGAESGGWFERGLSSPLDGGQWVDGVLCDLRVLYVDTLHEHGFTPSMGQSDVMGPISTTVSMIPETSVPASSEGHVSGLCLIHPLPDGDRKIHLSVDTPTLIVVKILSGKGATSSWLGPVAQTGVPFLPSCPGALPDTWPGCRKDSRNTWFSHVSVVLPSVGVHTLNVSAVNEVSEQSTSVQVFVYEPVTGLSIEPHGHLRMLVELPQVFTAKVNTGSSVKYLWVVDDLEKYSYEGDTYNVVFRKPAEYKLKVTVTNPVSSQTVEVTVTADTMTPLANPEFLSVNEVIAVDTIHLYTFRVKADVSLGITFSWSFGDASAQMNHTFPAPSESQDMPVEPGMRQVYVEDSVSHAYLQPDDYTLTVRVYNPYDCIEGAVSVRVRPPLTRLLISPSPPVPSVHQTILLEAFSQPSPYGILYTWDFGDGSEQVQGSPGQVTHVVRHTGLYNMTVRANNTLTALTAWVAVEVVEKVSGLQLSCSGPSELKSVTEIKGKVASGSSLHWAWDLGDGSEHKCITHSSVSHVYKSPGSYTVRVTVSNAISQASQAIQVEIYRLAISGILPSECSETEKEIHLEALVNGNVSLLTFQWIFGDGSPLSIQKGKSIAFHTYSNPGIHNISVTVVSKVASVVYDGKACIEALITELSLRPSHDVVAVGEEVCFEAVADPKTQPTGYQFLWFDQTTNSSPVRGLAHHCSVYEEGIHDIAVMASNTVSQRTANVTVSVQKLVTEPSIAISSQNHTLTVNEKATFWVRSCTGTNVSVLWDFGDGSPWAKSSPGVNVSNVFTSAGRFTVKATASNAVSRESATLDVNVLLPLSDLTLEICQPFAEVGEETVIAAVGNVAGDVSYYWSVKGTATHMQGTSKFRYVFPKAGEHEVKVTAQNLVSRKEAVILIEALERIQGLQISSQNQTPMVYIPTRECVFLTASVTHGSNVTYHWLVNQTGVTQTASVGESFQLFAESLGNISVQLTASNGLSKMTSCFDLKAVERVSGARMSMVSDTVSVGKPVNISVTLDTGSDLQYLWNVNSDLLPIQTDVPFLLYMFDALGHPRVSVSVQNVLGSISVTKYFTVQEEVREIDFQINGKTHPFFIIPNHPVQLSGYVRKGSSLHWEWKVDECTGVTVVLANNQSVIYNFNDVGVHKVSLNVSNNISWHTVSHKVTIQDIIQGFTINLSGSTVCANDHIVFTPVFSKGTSVSFSLAIDEVESSYDLAEGNVTTSTLPVGSHCIIAKAWNQVSNSQISLAVHVVERIHGLRLVNCCSTALDILKEIHFQADVISGSPTDYIWTIQLEGFKPLQVTGKEVMYSSPGSGLLYVSVMASNGFCSETLNETAIVQVPVKEVKIVCDSTEIFSDYSVTFLVKADGGSNLRFRWDFGDTNKEVVVTEYNTVDHIYVTPGEYIVQVTAFNNISQVSTQLRIEVRELQCSLPNVTLVQSQSTILKSRPGYFEARVDAKGCTAYKTMYLWEVFSGSSSHPMTQSSGYPITQDSGGHQVNLTSLVDVTTPLLSLPKQALEVGQYTLKFTVSRQSSPLCLYRTSRLSVVHSSLVPIISGGSHRLVPSHSDLFLDGSESHDPDVDLEEDGELKFLWDLITENPTERWSQDQNQFVGCENRTLMVASGRLQPGRDYLFTLTVHKEGRGPVSTTQSVTVSPVAVLPVSVECVSCSTQSGFRVSHSRPIVLSGRCDRCGHPVQYKWSAEDQNGMNLDLNEVITTTQGLSPDLVVRPGVLQAGYNYTFTLNVTHITGGRWGCARITLLPNLPPQGGVCTLTPGHGEIIQPLETVVTYNCSGWLDEDSEDSQLIYTLQVALSCSGWDQEGALFTLYRGTQCTFGSLVPLGEVGPEKYLSVIFVILQVEDSLGSKVTALNGTLKVLRPGDGDGITEWLRNKSQTEFWGLLQQGNPQQLIPFSIALSSQLNQVDEALSEQDLRYRREIRANVTLALSSLPVSSLQVAAQISSALAQSTAVPSEVVCEGCQEQVLESVGRMIKVLEKWNGPRDDTTIETGKNILQVIGSSLAAVSDPNLLSSAPHTHVRAFEVAASALDHAGALMRSLMRSRARGEESLSLSAPQISAVGYHGYPSELLCTTGPSIDTWQSNRTSQFKTNDESYPPHHPCQFLIPPSFSEQLQREVQGSGVVQILLGLEGGSEFLSAANPPICTSLAAMEFTTPQGNPIPINDLDTDSSIRVTLPSRYTVGRFEAGEQGNGGSGRGDAFRSGSLDRDPMVHFTLPANGCLNFTLKPVKSMHPNAGLYMSLNFSLLPGTSQLGSGHVRITVATQSGHSASHDSLIRELTISLSTQSAMENTVFLSPLLNSTKQFLYVNLTSSLRGAPVQASVCVFSSLCQYFSLRERRWSSEGLWPLEGSTLHSAHCLTQHLTIFGASLFVHPDALVLLPPTSGSVRNVVVGVVCVVLVIIHILLGLIAHKLDHLERLRLCHVPLCGWPGRYSYRVLVKTGWRRGAGTTAHVGISLFGVTKSGSRHLQQEGAFQRNGLDLFHLETDSNLGEVWKIRLWHDNTGLDPSWYVKHVVVWDPQRDHVFYFLVEDWLSVENDRNEGGGTVEKEVLASCPEELFQFRRVLSSQLMFGILERHLWLSLWECPAHSQFTRSQRVTVCALLLHLFLAIGAMWYGAVGTQGQSGPVSARLLVTSETVVIGMTVAVMVLPLQCLICFLFRKTRSQVAVDMSGPPSPVCQSVEMDVDLGQSDISCSSFLSLPGGHVTSGLDRDTPSSLMGSKVFDAEFWNATILGVENDGDVMTLWPSCDSLTDLQGHALEIPSNTLGSSVGHARLLTRKKALMKLCLASPSSTQSLVSPSSTQSLVSPSSTQSLVSPSSTQSLVSPSIFSLFSPVPVSLSQSRSHLLPECIHSHSHNLPGNALTLSEEDLLRSIDADAGGTNILSTPDSGRYSPRTPYPSHIQSQGRSCSSWSELSVDKPLYGTETHKPFSSLTSLYGTRRSSSLTIDSIASTFIPSPSPDSSDSPTRIGVARDKPGWLLPPWTLSVIYPLVALVLGACLAIVGLYGSYFSNPVVLMWLISGLSAFLTSALILEPVKVFVQALFYAVVFRPVDPEVSDRLGQESVVRRDRGRQGGKVRPPCGFGLLQAKEEARKVKALRSIMKHCVGQMGFLLVVLMVNYQDCVQETQGRLLRTAVKLSLTSDPNSMSGWEGAWQWMDNTLVPHLHQNPALHLVGLPRIRLTHTPDQNRLFSLGNNTMATRQLLSRLHSKRWTTAELKTVSIDFTQYHRGTGVFLCVSVLLERIRTHTVLHSLSILPLIIPPSSSGPDLQIALMVLLLLSALYFLGAELWAMATEHAQYLREGCHWLQLLLVSLSLATATLRICFLFQATSCLSQHHFRPDSFTEFHSAALLARKSIDISAILLTLLVFKMVATLRFVRRWVVFGRLLQQAGKEVVAIALLVVLLMLLFSHTGYMLFSRSVDGFLSVSQAVGSVLSMLRGGLVLQRLSGAHPVLGPLYTLSLLGLGGWLLARFSGAVLLCTYRFTQAEMYRIAMEPQDYEMVRFFIKRLKLWMGLIKAKQFRHRVKFEGVVVPPSRSSRESCVSSSLSSFLSSPRPLSSTASLRSEDFGFSDAPSLDVQPYLDRLLPLVDTLLSRFDRVNQLAADIHGLEKQLEEAESSKRTRKIQGLGGERRERGGRTGARVAHSLISLPSSIHLFDPITSLSRPTYTNPSQPCIRSSFSESAVLQIHPLPLRDAQFFEKRKPTHGSPVLGLDNGSSRYPEARQFPRRRAWHSGSSQSADSAQRPLQAMSGQDREANIRARPQSEEGGRRRSSEGLPVKRRAWISEGPETDPDSDRGSCANYC